MSKTIAILAPGAMGSAVARRLSEHGAQVLTSLKGRSEATRKRAADAGMIGAEDDAIAGADIILSIVPPGEAVALAERLAGLIVRREKKPVVVDCNAVNVDTVMRIEEIIGSAQAPFVDAGIIGFPPQPGGKSPAFYMSGEHAKDVASHQPAPSWLEIDRDNYKGRVLSLPKREDIQLPVNEQLIVELYSK